MQELTCWKLTKIIFAKKLAKLADIWQSHRKNKKGDVFWITV